MPPETQYANGPRGQIAYQVLGEGEFDLVYISGATSHIDVRWESPSSTRFLERLASFSRLITFDRRGVGASDPIPLDEPPNWEDWAEDLTVVMEAAGSERASIVALLDGAAMALLFAATHPERTRALVLGNASARLLEAPDYPQGISAQAGAALRDLIGKGWGTEEFALLTQPGLVSDERERKWFAKFMRAGASPRMAEMQLGSLMEADLRPILPSVQVPTLVLHRKGFQMIPIEQGRFLADQLADARFVELEGADASLALGDSEAVLDAVEEFLTGERRQPDLDRVLATLLITDLVGSTERASELGDRKWREVLARHDELAKTQIESHRGRLWKMTGDGVLATFDAPGRAIRCALGLDKALSELGLRMRAGLHTGEVELRGNDVGGIAVHLAARLCTLAGAGEALVSRTVTDLVTGSGIRFRERGVHSLKGVPGEWQVYVAEG